MFLNSFTQDNCRLTEGHTNSYIWEDINRQMAINEYSQYLLLKLQAIPVAKISYLYTCLREQLVSVLL